MNKLCRLCVRDCKQSDAVKVIECKRYNPAPVQLVLKFAKRKGLKLGKI